MWLKDAPQRWQLDVIRRCDLKGWYVLVVGRFFAGSCFRWVSRMVCTCLGVNVFTV